MIARAKPATALSVRERVRLMNESAKLPLPLRAGSTVDFGLNKILAADGSVFAAVRASAADCPQQAENIVRACNAYPALLAERDRLREALVDALALQSPVAMADANEPENVSLRASWIRKARAALSGKGAE